MPIAVKLSPSKLLTTNLRNAEIRALNKTLSVAKHEIQKFSNFKSKNICTLEKDWKFTVYAIRIKKHVSKGKSIFHY